uniref:Potassium/proton antiporter CemA n=1 Tax=Haplomitrium blumei TaxID=258993 RepID=A0A4Y5P8K6_9MARC|nr:chloroplast envelope membrane protein [Haplomitrium blumei]QCW59346.1 chloroplast envelope membrane protein [Haplomitrium blumei]
MKNWYRWKILRWISNTPYRSLEKAYEASKRIQRIKGDYSTYKKMVFSSKRSWRSIPSYTTKGLNDSVSIIYWGLIECKFSLYIFNLFQRFEFIIPDKKTFASFPTSSKENFPLIVRYLVERKMNRKLAWIEATLIDLDVWRKSLPLPLATGGGGYGITSPRGEALLPAAIAYESIGFIPRSITRTFSRFEAELKNQSNSLVLREFRLVKYQALASLQYLGCLILLPTGISTLCNKYFLRFWIESWWNSCQSEIFLNSFQENRALERLKEVEELLWLDNVMPNPPETHSQDLTMEIHEQTIRLVKISNEYSVRTISNLLTDIISFATPSALFVSGKKRLAISNSRIQESFYSLSDTTKAFSILLLTDLCIGSHSPHGWEIIISFCPERFGFVHNKHVISCFVSTFPVILDTVSKYWIFRHLNRISPSIVATYHAMNE